MRQLFEQQQKSFAEQQQAFLADREARAAESQRLLETNLALTARIDELLSMGQSEQDRRLGLERELQEERARSAQSRPLVDVSKLGQKAPEKFADTEATWPDWSWHYRNYLAAANPAARPAMKFAESCGSTPVDESDVSVQGWRVMSDQLYSSLVGFTQGESSSIVHNTAEGNGLEAWRKLTQRWNRTQAHSRVADKEQLMANSPVPDARLGKAIEDWEVRRKEYEGKHSKTLDDDDAQISLLRLCSGDLRKHLNLHYDSSDSDYAKLRAYLTNYLQRNRLPAPGATGAGGGGGGAGSTGGAAPMDISALRKELAQVKQSNTELLAALGKGAPGKGGGPKAKAKAKAGGGGGSSSSGGSTQQLHPWQPTEREKQLECRKCHKTGHTERTCYEKHPELKEQAAAHRKATKSAKKLAALTDAPRAPDGSVLLAPLSPAPVEPARPLPAAEDHRRTVAALGDTEREELRRTLEEESRALAAYLLGEGEPGGKEEEQALANTLLTKAKLPDSGSGSRMAPGAGAGAAGLSAAAAGTGASGVLFDTAAGATCVPGAAVSGQKPLPGVRGPALETASGESVKSAGEVYDISIHTGGRILPARATAADVVQPILAAHDYCGPGGEFEATLRPAAPELKHLPTGTVFPLRWEDNTLKLATAAGATADAKRLQAKLAALSAGKAGNGRLRATGKDHSERDAQNRNKAGHQSASCAENRTKRAEQTEEEKEKLRTDAQARVAKLGSAAFRLSRLHLCALARALGVRAAGGVAPSKKELFRLVTAGLPQGAGRGLRPGRPGRELPAL